MNELVESPGELEAAARKLAGEMLACSRVGLQESSPASCRLGGCCPLALLSSRDWRFEAHPASHAACFLPLLASLLFCLYAQVLACSGMPRSDLPLPQCRLASW